MSRPDVLRIPTDTQLKAIRVMLQNCGDGGANLLVGMLVKQGHVAAEFVGEQFFGYESKGREPITVQQLQEFVLLILASEQVVHGSKVLIKILGNYNFKLTLRQEFVENAQKSVSKHPHHHDRDKRGQHRGGRGRR